ncbi:MAG: sensor domain-containing protein [Micrococcales bacterium]|nr:sensor domain-containing protein [Micrococcales bacterium]
MSSTTLTRDDVTVVAPALCGARALLLAPVSGASWRAFGLAVIGWVWLWFVGITLFTLVFVGVATLPLAGFGLLLLTGTLWTAHWFAVVEAARLTAQTGVDVVAAPRRRIARRGFWRTVLGPLADGHAWAALGYVLLGLVVSTVAAGLLVGLSAAAVAGLGAPWFLEQRDVPVHSFADFMSNVGPVRTALVALLLVWVVPVLAQAFALLQAALGRGLLAQSETAAARAAQRAAEKAQRHAEAAQQDAEARAVRMVHRAEHLAQTRSDAVEAAADDRRRIERDLHDGAQQRLVALGMELGVARRRAATDPDTAVVALEHAHAEVKETLAELRDLVRGIHPAVLTDRGLDAALSALAARSPVPVTVCVADSDTLAACGPAAQAAAYFVVAEALTNTAKHAHASAVTVDVGCTAVDSTAVDNSTADDSTAVDDSSGAAGSRLRVVVTDDGIGGADTAAGTGLDGLRARVAALDGTFDLVSPPDGGTRLTVEVPCVS